MQKKSNFLTKFVKKDYNNKLEEVLSKKDFSEEVKNTLLSMFYKIENGYKDYKNVKRETFEKKEYIEKLINIVDKDCKKITFIPINSKEKEIVDSENQEIKCLPIETKILYGLAKIQKRNMVVKYIDESIEEALSDMLNIGNNINIVEPLRDFNGFSWNIITKDIEDLNYNLLYQNMIFLYDNKFVDKWVNNYEPLVDYFDLFQGKVESRYGKREKNSIIKNLIRISLKLKATYHDDFKNRIIEKSEEIENEKDKISNKTQYLEEISKNKKQKEKEIRELDKIINDKNLLIEEYEKRNDKLPLEKKIFSIRVLKNNLKKERENLLLEIENYNKIMMPKNFLELKKNIEKKYEYFKDIDDLNFQKELINLQKQIIKCMYLDISKIKEKTELIEYIYIFRYYVNLPITNEKNIYQTKELKKYLKKLMKELIDKSEELKIINQISKDNEKNYSITENLFLSKIIELENINLKPTKEEEKIYITVYDEEIEDSKIELKDIEKKDLKIKLNKKTKLFI